MIDLTREQFRQLYLNYTASEIFSKTGLSYFKQRKYAEQLGIIKKKGRPFKKYEFKGEE